MLTRNHITMIENEIKNCDHICNIEMKITLSNRKLNLKI